MAYYLDLFTRETWAGFRAHGSDISGFRERQRKTAQRIGPGDTFLCYIVGVSRWCGILDVLSEPFTDDSPIFSDPDPFTIRYRVAAEVQLDLEKAIPIYEPALWESLSFTREMATPVRGWAQHANLRASLREIEASDAELIMSLLRAQGESPVDYPLTPYEQQKLRGALVRAQNRSVVVAIPDDEEEAAEDSSTPSSNSALPDEARSSHKVQGSLASIGAKMGFSIWIPANDRVAVRAIVEPNFADSFLETLPLNYDDATLKTVSNIDVIWLKGRSIVRAFEVEHTTAIYSGLLRMADLLALQPNMDIRLHIVAPDEKREKVMREIKRPVFSLLEKGPLYDSCTYIPYSAIEDLGSMKHLEHMSDSIMEEYEEFAEDS